MHEIWLSKQILQLITKTAKDRKLKKVNKVIIEIGQLVAVDKLSLTFGFDLVAKGTIAENALLEIKDTFAEAFCEKCTKKVSIMNYGDNCSICNGYSLKIIKGDEFKVLSMEAE